MLVEDSPSIRLLDVRRTSDCRQKSRGADKVTSNAGDLDRSSDDQDADGYDLSCRLPSRPRAPTSAVNFARICVNGSRIGAL